MVYFQRITKTRSSGFLAQLSGEPQPCARFKRMRMTPAFLRHFPRCEKCKAVVSWLVREFEREAAPAKSSARKRGK